MVIRLNCPACKALNTVADDKRGKKVRCTRCEKLMAVPAGDNGAKKKSAETEAVQSGRKLKVAGTRKRADEDADDENDDEDRPAKKKKQEPAKGGSGMMLAVGGVLAALLLCLVGGGGIGAIYLFRGKPDAEVQPLAKVEDKKADEKNDAGDKKDAAAKNDGDKQDNPGERKNDPVVVDPDAGKPLPPQLAPELLAKAKKATVYLHVTMPSGAIAEGSGFFAMERGIIVTNAHVLGMLLPTSRPPKQVDVVQDSGLPTETKMVGEVLGVDRVSDLAIIRVPDNPRLPTPLLLATEAPAEVQMVYIFGFPFGERLGKNITITEKKITSLRPDQIQIDGGMNPGNSGGPVVNTRGQLLGVSVSIISGAQISFAVPAEKVRQVMAGRVSDHQHGEAFALQGKVHVPIRLAFLDPLDRIREVRVEIWTGPGGAPRPATEQKPAALAGDSPRQEYAVKYAKGVGAVDVPLPQLPGGHVYWAQPIVTTAQGVQWAAAQTIQVSQSPLERAPADLTISLATQKERFSTMTSVDTTTYSVGTKKTVRSERVKTELLEVLSPEDYRGKPAARVKSAYGFLSLGISRDGKKVTHPDLQKGLNIVRTMPPTCVIYDTNEIGSFITVTLNPKNPLKEMVSDLNHMVQNPLEAATVKMPNRVVQPMDTFETKSMMLFREEGKNIFADLMMTCTYQGKRMREGREEALITFVGNLQGRGEFLGKIEGNLSGKIGFDMTGRFLSLVQLKITSGAEMNTEIGKITRLSEQDIEVLRVPGNPKNLALVTEKTPGPGPGTSPGAGGATKILGGGFDPQFKDDAPEGSLLVGLEVGLAKAFGTNDTIKAMRPIYRNDKGEETIGKSYGKDFKRTDIFKAKPGYAVAALHISAGAWVDGISATFMKIDGAKLDPKDSYTSNQLGTKGGVTTTIGGNGTLVVGVVGKANQNDFTGLGLLLKQEGSSGGAGGPIAGGGAVANPAPNQFFNGDLTLRHLTFMKQGKILGDLVWAPDAKSFYMLTDNGTIQQIELASGQTTQFVELGRPASHLALSGEGLLVAVPDANELWVIDPSKLADVKKKISVPGIRRVSAGTTASLAYAGPDKGNAPLQVVDLQKGAVVKSHAKVPIFLFRASPDGKYVFSVGRLEQLLRFRVNGDDLIEEEASYRISGNGQNISFSPDSKYVTLGTGAGNGKGHPDHPPLGNYTTYVYPIGNIKKPVTGFASGGYPRVAGLDPRNGFIYAQNAGKPLLVYGFRNGDTPLGGFDFPIKGRVDVLEFSVSPVGGDALVRMEKSLVHIKVNKAALPPLGRLDENPERRERSQGISVGAPGEAYFRFYREFGPLPKITRSNENWPECNRGRG